MRLLIVEDEVEMAEPLRAILTREGHSVEVAHDGEKGEELLQTHSYDLLILDWMLPGCSGLELCRRVRAQGNALPVLMLTAKDTVDDRVQGLDVGADDYLVKPFELKELLARVRALLRRPVVLLRSAEVQEDQIQVGDVILDLKGKLAFRQGRPIELSAKELQLLELLMRRAGEVLTHEEILLTLWEEAREDASASLNLVAAHIKLLRRKIDKEFDSAMIHTVYGLGYRFGLERKAM
jgi:two-component system, OmpR family, manganese sensing response regulator